MELTGVMGNLILNLVPCDRAIDKTALPGSGIGVDPGRAVPAAVSGPRSAVPVALMRRVAVDQMPPGRRGRRRQSFEGGDEDIPACRRSARKHRTGEDGADRHLEPVAQPCPRSMNLRLENRDAVIAIDSVG